MEPQQPKLISPQVMDLVVEHLAREFGMVFGVADIERMAAGSVDLLEGIRSGPLRADEVEQFTRDRLRAQGRVEGTLLAGIPAVIFVCVHNAGRSQMSAGWARHLGGERLLVFSGGSAPAEAINPRAVEAMTEVGIDISAAFPVCFTDEIVQAADVVVTMGCGDACPYFPNKRYMDWDLADPHDAQLEDVRSIRDEIGRRVEHLLAEMGVR
jgi:protein-tyrosine-phosphatase